MLKIPEKINSNSLIMFNIVSHIILAATVMIGDNENVGGNLININE